MGSEWRETTLGQVVKDGDGLIQTGPFGSQLHASDYKLNGVPVIMPMNISSNRVDITDIARISHEDANRLSKHLVESGDIVYSRRGDVTLNALITYREAGMFCGTGCLLVRPGRRIDSKFLKYHLNSPRNQEWIVRHAVGATMPNLNTAILANVPLLVPSLSIQKAIAHILGSLDDKIVLNRRMNSTLEGMAQALFKSWFVDFDPVIDNAIVAGNPIPEELADRAEVRRAALANGTANREAAKPFPAAFQQTEELGWIPEGWEVSTVGEEVDAVGGATPSTSNGSFWNGNYPFCTPKDMSSLTSLVLTDTERHLTESGVREIGSGLLPAGTVVMSSRAPIGYLAISQTPITINQGIIGLLNNDNYSPMFLLNWLRANMDRVVERANGSTFLEISKKNFRPIPFLRPNKSALDLFASQSVAIHDRIASVVGNTKHLTKLRDTLLPKLISGELRIQDAEKLTEAAVA